MKITIFTPTYNRKALLETVYQSLEQQTNIAFEWLIVDDGSADNTADLIDTFKAKSPFPIRYFYKQNEGKHIAINYGVQQAKGSYFVILDSDDKLPQNAVDIILKMIHEAESREIKNLGGIVGRKAHYDHTLVGNDLPQEYMISDNIDIRYKENITGDLAEIFKTSVLKEFPFPKYEGEKFCPEVLIWNRIAMKYKLLFSNEIIYLCEYLPGGLTDSITRIRMKSPQATLDTYYEMWESKRFPFKQRVKSLINYWRFYPNLNNDKKYSRIPKTPLNIITKPIGNWMYNKDKRVLNESITNN